MTHTRSGTVSCLAMLGLTACTLDYHVDMVPMDDSLDRTVTVSYDVPGLQVERLRDVYGTGEVSGPADDPNLRSYQTRVVGTHWPDGFGGEGAWTTVTTPIGTMTLYTEVLGGSVPTFDDLMRLADGLEAVETFFRKHLLEHLGDDQEVRDLLKVIRHRVLPDARDAAVMGWALVFSYSMLPDLSDEASQHARKAIEERMQSRLFSAMTAFLYQRRWITAEEAALFSNEMDLLEEFSDRIVARALGWKETEGWHERVEGLFDRIDETFDQGPEDKEQLDDAMMKAFSNAVGDSPHLTIAFRTLTAFLTSHDVTFRLHAQTEPDITNGTWVDHDGRRWVEWTSETAPLAVGLLAPPMTLHAVWVEPDDAAQSALLGDATFSPEEMAEFCTAWAGSTSRGQRAVEKALDSIRRSRRSADVDLLPRTVLKECLEMMLEEKPPRHAGGN